MECFFWQGTNYGSYKWVYIIRELFSFFSQIQRRDVDVPEGIAVCELTDYPPKFSIFLSYNGGDHCSPPKLQIQGLDVGDCSFEIITPGKLTKIVL